MDRNGCTLILAQSWNQKDQKELPGIEVSLHSVWLWLVGCEKQRPMEGAFFQNFSYITQLLTPPRAVSAPQQEVCGRMQWIVMDCNGRTLRLAQSWNQKDQKELPGVELPLHSVLLSMVGCEKQRPMEGVFVKFSQLRFLHLPVLCLPRSKKYVEGCNGY